MILRCVWKLMGKPRNRPVNHCFPNNKLHNMFSAYSMFRYTWDRCHCRVPQNKFPENMCRNVQHIYISGYKYNMFYILCGLTVRVHCYNKMEYLGWSENSVPPSFIDGGSSCFPSKSTIFWYHYFQTGPYEVRVSFRWTSWLHSVSLLMWTIANMKLAVLEQTSLTQKKFIQKDHMTYMHMYLTHMYLKNGYRHVYIICNIHYV